MGKAHFTLTAVALSYSLCHSPETLAEERHEERRAAGHNVYRQPDAATSKSIFERIARDPKPIVVYGEPPGSKIEFLRTGKSTCGKYLYAKVTIPPGSGPPPHMHHWTDEWFYFPAGGAVMFHGTTPYKDLDNPPDQSGKDTVLMIPMEKGSLMYGPRFMIHGYTNATDKPIEVHIVWTPDTPDISILGYFLSIYAPVFKDKSLNAQFNSVQSIKAVGEARKYGMNFSHHFWQYIKDVKFVDDAGDPHVDRLRRILADGDRPCSSDAR